LTDSIDATAWEKLLSAAREIARRAHAPYSRFHVGAAILARDGQIITGCNVENASYGLAICAERTAAVQAVARGIRDWSALVVVSPTGVSPCGACRQFLSEFGLDLPILIGYLDRPDTIGPIRLQELLPLAMRLDLS
jgi:cytidine deaminase